MDRVKARVGIVVKIKEEEEIVEAEEEKEEEKEDEAEEEENIDFALKIKNPYFDSSLESSCNKLLSSHSSISFLPRALSIKECSRRYFII